MKNATDRCVHAMFFLSDFQASTYSAILIPARADKLSRLVSTVEASVVFFMTHHEMDQTCLHSARAETDPLGSGLFVQWVIDKIHKDTTLYAVISFLS